MERTLEPHLEVQRNQQEQEDRIPVLCLQRISYASFILSFLPSFPNFEVARRKKEGQTPFMILQSGLVYPFSHVRL